MGEICTKFSSSKGEVLLLLDAGRRKINKKDKARRPTNTTQNNRMFFSRTTERKESAEGNVRIRKCSCRMGEIDSSCSLKNICLY